MRPQHHLACFLLFAAVLLASRLALGGLTIGEQRAENTKWKDAAEKLQQDYYNKARDYEKDKKDSLAIEYYRKVLSVYYDYWDIQKKSYVRSDNEKDDSNYQPARRTTPVHLKGSLYDQARKRIESLQGKAVTDDLSEIEKRAKDAEKKKDYAKAYVAYQQLRDEAQKSRDKAADSFETRAESRLDQIEKNALRALDQVERALKGRDTDRALAQFQDFEQQYGSFDFNEKVHGSYMKLTEDPILAKLKGEVDAKKQMAQAEEYSKKKLYGYAYYEYQFVIQEFANTDLAKEAAGKSREMEANQEVFRQIHEIPRERYAGELVRRANALLKDSDVIAARRLYRHVTAYFADCPTPCSLAAGQLKKLEPATETR